MKYMLTALALAAGITAPAHAVAISGLFNTGVDALGNEVNVDGTTELHYVVNGGTGVTYQHPAWFNVNDAHWISAQPNGGYSVNPGIYTLTFSLAGLNAATAQLSGAFAVDDNGTVSLNGGTAIATTGSFGALTAFSFNSGFLAGANTLTFTVTDTGGVPAGLLVSGLSGTADALGGGAGVPEPATWGLMVLGFGMVGFAARRRRKAVFA